ncbi:aminotransferase class III-fold pyridoxal phosphate-dependent enzyme [Nitrosopumilus maritimus]|uniref:Aminotransferase class-III n=1 Tax=Nitrosopumilus maritimus (strain SCM1) TaxID=436308 RepID=A9A1S7_NITMS|nr:aminotransferase class III-fold pyridoxal phosphate-dependent enzyme [Nitrosopumilus maritimus]ABX12048.1 aminotransferase class-III [Nitrosopumilus maritimus SCM1]
MTNVLHSLDNSNNLKERARKVIPHLTGTFSRAAPSYVEGVFPVYIQSGNGSHFTDVDQNEYIDYLMGLGPITLGYNYEPVNRAIISQLNDGILFSLPHPIEVELSEKVCEIIPHAEMTKFEKSGSNAVTGAVRAARAFTKNEKIAYCGSGGVWHDWQAAMVSRDDGVPKFNSELIKLFDYNDADGLEQIFDDNPNEIAAIVLEPTMYEKPENDFLKKVRKIATQNNSLLILDEIVTGFRFDLAGAQKYFDIKGDLVCFGKGMGNGLPISAITGPSEYMKIFDKLWVSSTNNSETLSLAGTKAVISEMQEKNTISHCWKIGESLLEGWNKIVEKFDLDAKMSGYPIRMHLKCFDSKHQESLTMKSLLLQEMVKNGVFMSVLGATFISYSHSLEDVQKTLSGLETVCEFISKNVKNDNYLEFLEGELPKTIWSMKLSPTKKKNQ